MNGVDFEALQTTALRLRREQVENGRDDDAEDHLAAMLWSVPAAIGDDEWTTAKLAPDCIVEGYLYADVACQIGPGSTGKTTASLFEAVHIALGRNLWGLRVLKPGPVLYVTAEDRREFLVARLREICTGLGLSAAEVAKVRQLVRIDDCTKHPRRLTAVVNDVVMGSGFADDIVRVCQESGFAPVLVQFDPMVSFGVGESRVNDAEQGLVEAARVIVAGLNCCARYVHHSGKANAREKTADQYTGRGGSALPDGARMVTVLQPMNAAEWMAATGDTIDADRNETAFVLARPKLSYCAPQPDIFILRCGYSFRCLSRAAPIEPDKQRGIDAEQVLRLIRSEAQAGRQLTKSTLEDIKPESLTRSRFRAALAVLLSDRRIESRKREGAKNGAYEYLDITSGSPSCDYPSGEPT